MNPKNIIICFLGLLLLLYPKTVYSVQPYSYNDSVDLYSYDSADFIIEGTYLKGLSAAGMAKVQSNGGYLTLPYNIQDIAPGAFKDNEYITNVFISSTLNEIGASAFANCVNLKHVYTAGNPRLVFGSRAFYNCVNLESVAVTAVNIVFGEYSFEKCISLLEIPYPQNPVNPSEIMVTIEDNAFRGCEGLINVSLIRGTSSIGKYAFFDCIRLSVLELPDTITSIGEDAFTGCVSLNTIINHYNGKQTVFPSNLPSHVYSPKVAKGYSINSIYKSKALAAGYTWHDLGTGEIVNPDGSGSGDTGTPTPTPTPTSPTPTPSPTPVPTPDWGSGLPPAGSTPPVFDSSMGNLFTYDAIPIKYNFQAVFHGEKNISYALTPYQKLLRAMYGGESTQSFKRASTFLSKTGNNCFIFIK